MLAIILIFGNFALVVTHGSSRVNVKKLQLNINIGKDSDNLVQMLTKN